MAQDRATGREVDRGEEGQRELREQLSGSKQVAMLVYIYIYIYIYRQRERSRVLLASGGQK